MSMKPVSYQTYSVKIYDTSVTPERLLFAGDRHFGVVVMEMEKALNEQSSTIRVDITYLP